MERKHRIDALGASFLLLFSLLMGLNQVCVKIVNDGLQPVFQAGLRSALAFFPVLAYSLITGKRLSISDGSLVPGLICGTFFASEFVLLFIALEYTTVSRASIFFYTMPFWVALAAHFFIPGERLTPIRVAGLVLAFAGVAMALSSNHNPASQYAFIGDLFCLVGAVFWAGIAMLARTTKLARSTPEMQLLYQLAVSAPIMLVLAPFYGELVREMTPMIAAIFAFQVMIVVAIGFLLWFWVLSIYPASDMASFGFLAPLFGVAFGWMILGEEISHTIILALVLVATGIYLVNRRPRVHLG